MQAHSNRFLASFLAFALMLMLSLTARVQADALRDRLSVFFEFNALDSVVSLEQKSNTALEITVADGATGETRRLREEVGEKAMQKLLVEANDLGLKTIPLSPVTNDTSVQDKPSLEVSPTATALKLSPLAQVNSPPKSGRSVSSQRKNRMWYMIDQTVLSTAVYGISIPLALKTNNARVQVATPMLVAPFAFGAHFWFSKNRPFEDSHRKGTAYLSIASLYASYALPFAIMDQNDDPFRMASLLTIATYPAGVYGGYLLGDKYADLPGRIDTQEKFAIGFGTMGFFSPFLYFDRLEGNGEAIIRLALGQSVAMATMGHFLADHYRTGQNIPDGVNTGIMNHTVLGTALGLQIAAIADAGAVRPWMGAALLGGTLGFMEGLFYYRNSYDSQERGLYNTLGGLGGTLFGGGLAWLFYDANASTYSKKVSITSFLVGGTLLGYIATNILTDGMEDRTGLHTHPTWADKLAINLIPVPEAQVRDREVYYRYHIPGVSYRF